MRRKIMNTEMYGVPNTTDVHYGMINPEDQRIFGGFGHGFGFGRRPFFGFGRRPFGFGFGIPFLTGLAAGALLTPGYGYYPPYPYPYPYYPWV
jgi:hypothetical protein